MCCRLGGATATHPIMGRSGQRHVVQTVAGRHGLTRRRTLGRLEPDGAGLDIDVPERTVGIVSKSRLILEFDHVGRKRRRAEAPGPRDANPVKRDHERVAGLGARNRERSRLRVPAHRNGVAVPIATASIDRAGAHAVTRLHRQSRLVPAEGVVIRRRLKLVMRHLVISHPRAGQL